MANTTSIEQCLARKAATSRQIQAETGLNQTAVSRQLRALAERIVTLSNGRSPRYALVGSAFGVQDSLPIYELDSQGDVALVAQLRPLSHGGFCLQPESGASSLLLGKAGDGVYQGLPYFLQDMRPQGFLGRRFATALAKQTEQFSADPQHWNTDQLGRFLLANGDDLPGNFQFGSQVRSRLKPELRSVEDSEYAASADALMAGQVPTRLVAGELPQFTLFSAAVGAHVTVKFSPRGDSPTASRWRDILLTEFHAAQAIREHRLATADYRMLESDGRLFLETRRLDRDGEQGRRSMLSLQAIDSEFVGLGTTWPAVMKSLHSRGLVDARQLRDAEVLSAFGRYINNSDLQLDNLYLRIAGNTFELLPISGMASMGFAPQVGEVPPFRFELPDMSKINAGDPRFVAALMARSFWKRLAAEPRISMELRSYLNAEVSEARSVAINNG